MLPDSSVDKIFLLFGPLFGSGKSKPGKLLVKSVLKPCRSNNLN